MRKETGVTVEMLRQCDTGDGCDSMTVETGVTV